PHEESGRLGARLHQLHVSADEERQLRLLGVLSELLRYAELPAFFDGLPVECADCPAVCPPELDLHDAARVRPRCWRSPSAGRLAGELPRRVAVRPEVDVVRWRRWNSRAATERCLERLLELRSAFHAPPEYAVREPAGLPRHRQRVQYEAPVSRCRLCRRYPGLQPLHVVLAPARRHLRWCECRDVR